MFDARKHPARTLSESKGAIGTVTRIDDQSVFVAVPGGQIELLRVRLDTGTKLPAAQSFAEAEIGVGARLGT